MNDDTNEPELVVVGRNLRVEMLLSVSVVPMTGWSSRGVSGCGRGTSSGTAVRGWANVSIISQPHGPSLASRRPHGNVTLSIVSMLVMTTLGVRGAWRGAPVQRPC